MIRDAGVVTASGRTPVAARALVIAWMATVCGCVSTAPTSEPQAASAASHTAPRPSDTAHAHAVARAPDAILPDAGLPPFTWVEDAIVRGDPARARLALIFTGGEHGEGTAHILDVLHRQRVPASFFVTGDYLRNPAHHPLLRRMVAEGHYLGPHSDAHPLYCPWDDRSRSLIDEAAFKEDLTRNLADLGRYNAPPPGRVYFIPPYEWYNRTHARWAREMGVLMFNFTPGARSNRDWAPESHASFVPSKQIYEDILAYERRHGLNGHLLLLHLGSQRQDKMHPYLEPLITQLKARGYTLTRVDDLLREEG